jgi:hypothetical protein
MTHPTHLPTAAPIYDASSNSYFPALVRVVKRGEALYSTGEPRLNLGDDAIVEVYDARFPAYSDLGQYVTSCYAADFVRLRGAWDLDTGVPAWTLDAETVALVQRLSAPVLSVETRP